MNGRIVTPMERRFRNIPRVLESIELYVNEKCADGKKSGRIYIILFIIIYEVG